MNTDSQNQNHEVAVYYELVSSFQHTLKSHCKTPEHFKIVLEELDALKHSIDQLINSRNTYIKSLEVLLADISKMATVESQIQYPTKQSLWMAPFAVNRLDNAKPDDQSL
jgi:hypothetical protein